MRAILPILGSLLIIAILLGVLRKPILITLRAISAFAVIVLQVFVGVIALAVFLFLTANELLTLSLALSSITFILSRKWRKASKAQNSLFNQRTALSLMIASAGGFLSTSVVYIVYVAAKP